MVRKVLGDRPAETLLNMCRAFTPTALQPT
jgi:hypothetical protein